VALLQRFLRSHHTLSTKRHAQKDRSSEFFAAVGATTLKNDSAAFTHIQMPFTSLIAFTASALI
jgi:hypothetical protein